jgi:hypothetical protein
VNAEKFNIASLMFSILPYAVHNQTHCVEHILEQANLCSKIAEIFWFWEVKRDAKINRSDLLWL